VQAAGVLLPVYVLSDMAGLVAYHRDFSRRNVLILVPASCIGIGAGWASASLVSDRGVGLLVGLIGLGFCLNSWRQRRIPSVPRAAETAPGIFWGSLMGFTSFVSHAGAPVYQVFVLPQRLPKLVYAGTTTVVFAAVNWLKLIPYAALGQLSPGNLRVSAVLALPAVVGTVAGVRLVRILPQQRYYAVVQVLLLLVSVRLILKTFGV
jgi:uncharacterized membrane protein YfcA